MLQQLVEVNREVVYSNSLHEALAASCWGSSSSNGPSLTS